MKTINEIRNITATQEYDKHFWIRKPVSNTLSGSPKVR